MNLRQSAIFIFLTTVIVLIVFGVVVGFTAPEVAPAPRTKLGWRTYQVGGEVLCHPQADSLGKFQCIELPKGSVLAVPYEIKIEDPLREGTD